MSGLLTLIRASVIIFVIILRFSYQFSSVVCLFVPSAVTFFNYFIFIIFLILYYIFPVKMVVLDGNFALGCGPGMDYP